MLDALCRRAPEVASARRVTERGAWCSTKNLNASRPSEHPPVRGGGVSKRLGGIKGCKFKEKSEVI